MAAEDNRPCPRATTDWSFEAGLLERPKIRRASRTEKVSLVEVVGIEVQSFNGSFVQPDPRPAAANALRIFAEAQEPATTSNPTPEVYDTVRLVARISPAVEIRAGQDPVTVYFRALDVDDPSASAKPVDDEGLTADNRDDPKAGVFRLEMWTPPGAAADGPIGGVVHKEAASGAEEAAVIVRVSPRQGDNYRFVGSTLRSWVEAAVVKQRPVALGATPSWLDDAQARPLDTALEGTRSVRSSRSGGRCTWRSIDSCRPTQASIKPRWTMQGPSRLSRIGC